MRRPRLLLADDHHLVLEGFERLLEPEFDVVGTVEDGRALVAAARKLRPDIALLDIAMPVLNGIDAARQLRKICPETKLIFVTMHDADAFVKAAFQAGGAGYVLKRSALKELATAIRVVMNGGQYLAPDISMTLRELFEKTSAPSYSPVHQLTARQRQVLQLIAEGRTNKEIATLLGISVKGVEYHKAALIKILGTKKPAELTRIAASEGLVPSGLT
jgi:DNA-binding NarL/FixJ family response regulator